MKKLIVLIVLCVTLVHQTFAQHHRIIISELLYDTPLPNEGQNPHMHNGEFATIYNYGHVPVDISGWRLVSDPNQIFTFPIGSIMQPGARFIVAYRALQSNNFVLSDLFNGFQQGTNDMVFYMRTVIHANGGESLRFYLPDGTTQDSMRYEGTSQKSLNPRLEAFNADNTPGRQCVSLQRRNITVDENGVIVFCRLDWATDTVALEHYPRIALTENGKPMAPAPQFGEDIRIIVNGQTAQRRGNNFSVLSDCGHEQASIIVVAPQFSVVKINGATQTTAIVNLPIHGNNIINITITPQNTTQESYTLIVNKPIPFRQIVNKPFPNILSAINNPAINGGYTFTSYRWFRNGYQVGTNGTFHIGTGVAFNPNDVYYLETDGAAGTIRTCTANVMP
jgi:hypothetical protein